MNPGRIRPGLRLEAWALLAPAAAVLAAVALLPMLYVVWLSLLQESPLRPPGFAGLDNFVRLAADSRFWNALGNTLYFTLVSVALELVLGLGIALLLAGAGGRSSMRCCCCHGPRLPWSQRACGSGCTTANWGCSTICSEEP